MISSPKSTTMMCARSTMGSFYMNDIVEAFELAFGNTCDPAERPILAEYLQRAMGLELPELT